VVGPTSGSRSSARAALCEVAALTMTALTLALSHRLAAVASEHVEAVVKV